VCSSDLIMSFNGKRDVKLYSGKYWSKKNHSMILYESSYEYKAIRMMEDNDYITDYSRCGFRIPVTTTNLSGEKREFNYNPDFLVTFASGAQYILEVKAKGLMGDFFVKTKMQTAREMLKYFHLRYMVWTEKELGIKGGQAGQRALKNWFFIETGKTPPPWYKP
jgi:hypothetical protein